MLLSMDSGLNSMAQFMTVFIIFIFVLGITYFSTRYIAGVQKEQYKTSNMELIETLRISNSKYLQIVRVSNRYFCVAVCKDTVTMLGEIQKEELFLKEKNGSGFVNFQDVLEKMKLTKPENKKQDTNEENGR